MPPNVSTTGNLISRVGFSVKTKSVLMTRRLYCWRCRSPLYLPEVRCTWRRTYDRSSQGFRKARLNGQCLFLIRIFDFDARATWKGYCIYREEGSAPVLGAIQIMPTELVGPCFANASVRIDNRNLFYKTVSLRTRILEVSGLPVLQRAVLPRAERTPQ
jgi:hypothetical protein